MRILLLMLLPMSLAKPCIPVEPNLVGAFRPNCNSDGTWKMRQCWGSTGSCWCVDRDGNPKDAFYFNGQLQCHV